MMRDRSATKTMDSADPFFKSTAASERPSSGSAHHGAEFIRHHAASTQKNVL